jgi:hypothetical protein
MACYSFKYIITNKREVEQAMKGMEENEGRK